MLNWRTYFFIQYLLILVEHFTAKYLDEFILFRVSLCTWSSITVRQVTLEREGTKSKPIVFDWRRNRGVGREAEKTTSENYQFRGFKYTTSPLRCFDLGSDILCVFWSVPDLIFTQPWKIIHGLKAFSLVILSIDLCQSLFRSTHHCNGSFPFCSKLPQTQEICLFSSVVKKDACSSAKNSTTFSHQNQPLLYKHYFGVYAQNRGVKISSIIDVNNIKLKCL